MCWVLVCVGTSVRIPDHSSVLGLGILLCCTQVCSHSIEIPRNPQKSPEIPSSPWSPAQEVRAHITARLGKGSLLFCSEEFKLPTVKVVWENWVWSWQSELIKRQVWVNSTRGIRKDLILSCSTASSWALPWLSYWFVRERSGLNLSFFSNSVNSLEKIFLPSCRGTALPVPEDSGVVPV